MCSHCLVYFVTCLLWIMCLLSVCIAYWLCYYISWWFLAMEMIISRWLYHHIFTYAGLLEYGLLFCWVQAVKNYILNGDTDITHLVTAKSDISGWFWCHIYILITSFAIGNNSQKCWFPDADLCTVKFLTNTSPYTSGKKMTFTYMWWRGEAVPRWPNRQRETEGV